MKIKCLKTILLLSIGYIACPPKAAPTGEDQNPSDCVVQAGEAVQATLLPTSLLNSGTLLVHDAQAACAEPSQSLSTTTHTHHTNSLSKLPLELLQAILLSMGLISETQQMSKTKTQQAPDTEGEAPVVNTSREEPLFTLAKLAELSLVSKEWNRAIQSILRACRAYICDDKLQAAHRPSAIAHFLWNNQNTFFISHVLRWLSTSTEDKYAKRMKNIEALELIRAEALPDFRRACLPNIAVRDKLQIASGLRDKDIKAAIAVYLLIVNDTSIYTEYRLFLVKKLVDLGEIGKAKAIEVLLSMITDSQVSFDNRCKAERALVEIGEIGKAIEVYKAIIKRTKIVSEILKAAKGLERLGAIKEAKVVFLSIANTNTIDTSERIEAAKELERLGDTGQAQVAYLSILYTTKLDACDTVIVANGLAALGTEEAIEQAKAIYKSIVNDTTLETKLRLGAAKELARLGETEQAQVAYLSILNTIKLDALHIVIIAPELAALGTEEAIAKAKDLFLSIVNDTTVDAHFRLEAVKELERLGEIAQAKAKAVYVSIAKDPKIDPFYRFKAAKELERLEEIAQAINTYESIAKDPNVHPSNRVGVAKELERLEEIAQAINTYESIAKNPNVHLFYRFQAAKGLERLGEIAQAIDAYESILKISNLYPGDKAEAQEALARLKTQTSSAAAAASAS